MDRLAWAHRWLGFATVWLIGAHGVLTTIGYAQGDGASVVDEFVNLLTTYPYVLWATAGLRAVRDGRRQLDPGRPATAVVRDLVRTPPLRLPRDRPRVPAPAVHRGGLHPRPARGDLLDRAVRGDGRARADVPRRPAGRDLGSASAAGRGDRRRGARRRVALPRGPRPRSAARAFGPVLHAPLPDARGLVARPPVLDLVRTQRTLAPVHRQGAGRRQRTDPAPRGRDAGLRRGPVRGPDRRTADPARA